ncbi:MAG: hypothetical protein FJ320_09120 [SAR202 cluster bacterium]|nr:hypothetical protein [SAR202 cluster bacterium]
MPKNIKSPLTHKTSSDSPLDLIYQEFRHDSIYRQRTFIMVEGEPFHVRTRWHIAVAAANGQSVENVEVRVVSVNGKRRPEFLNPLKPASNSDQNMASDMPSAFTVPPHTPRLVGVLFWDGTQPDGEKLKLMTHTFGPLPALPIQPSEIIIEARGQNIQPVQRVFRIEPQGYGEPRFWIK